MYFAVLRLAMANRQRSQSESFPTLLLLEYNKYPEAYVAGLPARKRPIEVVVTVTPTKGLEDNIVRLFVNSRRSAHDFTVRELTLAKRREKRQATRAFDDDDSGPSISSNSNTERAEETIEEPPEQYIEKSLGHKRQALEEMAHTAKRRRAPRAAQPSVSQVPQDYGPRYLTRRSVPAEGLSGGGDGKENRGVRRSERT